MSHRFDMTLFHCCVLAETVYIYKHCLVFVKRQILSKLASPNECL